MVPCAHKDSRQQHDYPCDDYPRTATSCMTVVPSAGGFTLPAQRQLVLVFECEQDALDDILL